MRRWIFIVVGILLAIAGVVWTLQGLDVLGQSGGMNGQRVWVVIGPVAVLIGILLARSGIRAGRSAPSSPAPR